MPLKRELGLAELTLYGVGMIVGAGIYALIGKVCGLAGNGVWLSFALSSLLAVFTGLSYAELASIFTKDSAEYDYVKHATGKEFLGYLVAWFMLGSMLISATTVALGFAGYLAGLMGIPNTKIVAFFAIAFFSAINFLGIKLSAKINDAATILEVLGLLLIIFGAIAVAGTGSANMPDYFDFSLSGVVSGAVLAFFAYIGFGSIAKMGEEAKDPEKTVPKAILLSIFITTLLYIAVALAAITLANPQELYASQEPAALIASRIHPGLRAILSVIALFSTGNTVLLILVSSSRMVYGLASQRVFPEFLARVHKTTGTPHYAVLVCCIAASLLLLAGDIRTVAEVTNFWVFICYFFVNLSAILLRYGRTSKSAFRMPLNIGRFPLPAFFGLLASLFMMAESVRENPSPFSPLISLTLLLVLMASLHYIFKSKPR